MKTVKQCAEILGISTATIHKEIRLQTDWGRRFVRRDGVYQLHARHLKIYRPKAKRRGGAGLKIGFRVTAAEMDVVKRLATEARLSLADWCRVRCLGTEKIPLDNSGSQCKLG